MATLTDELARVEAEILRLETIRDYLRGRLADANGAAPKQRRRRRPAGRVTAAVAAEKVLSAAGGPMRTPDLLAAVQAEGATIKDSEGLYKTLSRSSKFVKAGRGLWTLA